MKNYLNKKDSVFSTSVENRLELDICNFACAKYHAANICVDLFCLRLIYLWVI